jgi:hypothetical protein
MSDIRYYILQELKLPRGGSKTAREFYGHVKGKNHVDAKKFNNKILKIKKDPHIHKEIHKDIKKERNLDYKDFVRNQKS